LHRWVLVTLNAHVTLQTRAGQTGNLLPIHTRPIRSTINRDALKRQDVALAARAIIIRARATGFGAATKERFDARNRRRSAPVREEKGDQIAHRE
jgi:hypothetical protein